FAGSLDVGADTAVPDQVNGCLEQATDEFVRGQVLFGDIEDVPDLRAEGDLLELAGEHAATFRNQLRVVIGPARARQMIKALTLIETATGIHRVGVDEDLQVVEGRQQAHRAGAQQTVAKYVAAHVTDTYDGNRVLLHVYAQLAEMPLYRDPGTPSGDGHALVVVPHRATGGEGIAHPEAVVGGNAVGNVGEGRRALVRGHHQVIVIVIVTDHLRRRYHLAVDEIIGDIQQTLDEDAVAGDGLLLDSITPGLVRQTPWHEAALGTHRDDHRVLHLLGLGQAQHLGAVVLFPIGPAQTTPGDLAAAQMHPLDPRRVDEDLVHRPRLRQLRNRRRVELQTEVILGLTLGIGLVEVGAQSGLDQVQIAAQDAVLVEDRHAVQRAQNGLFQLLLELPGAGLAGDEEAGLEQPHQLPSNGRMVGQGGGDIGQLEAHADLLDVARQRPQQRRLAPMDTRQQNQPVEGIVLRLAIPDRSEGAAEQLIDILDVQLGVQRVAEHEVMDPEGLAVIPGDL